MGVRLPRRSRRQRATHRRRGPRLRREPGRQGLRSQRGDRLHLLAVRREKRRPRRRHDRPGDDRNGSGLGRVLRRPRRKRVRGQRGDRRAALDHEARRSPARPHRRIGRLPQWPAVCAGRISRRDSRRSVDVRVLQIPRECERARRGNRHGKSGRRSRLPKRRSRRRRTPWARSYGDHRARASGAAPPSTSRGMCSTRQRATTTARRRRT